MDARKKNIVDVEDEKYDFLKEEVKENKIKLAEKIEDGEN
jgi:hypothetical protein